MMSSLMKMRIVISLALILLMVSIAFYIHFKRNQNNSNIETLNADEYIDGDFGLETPSPLEAPIIPTYENIEKMSPVDIFHYLIAVEDGAYFTMEDLDVKQMINSDLNVDLYGTDPKILIFHTHSQEDFIDSRPGHVEDTIIGIGDELARILNDEYHISVIHDVGIYDVVDGVLDRSNSYERMEPAIQQILDENPSIEIMIDLHRDGVPDSVHLLTEINGLPTARIMFVNGIVRLDKDGIAYDLSEEYPNPYINKNLTFTLNMQLNANEMYPLFARRIYIKPYRYSLHMRPMSLLVEAGANTNSFEEVKNAMKPLAEILMKVVSNK